MFHDLNEGWAIAYLILILNCFIFSITLPILVFQITKENIREIIRKRYLKFWFCIDLILCFFLLIFIWVLHPSSGTLPDIPSIFASVIATISILILFLCIIVYLSGGIENRIISSLSKKITASIRNHNYYDSDALADLISIGESSHGGVETQQILIYFKIIGEKIQSVESYTGSELEILIEAYEAILMRGNYQPTENNLLNAIKHLRQFQETCITSDCMLSSDYDHIARLIRRIIERSNSKDNYYNMQCVYLTADDSRAQFMLGLRNLNFKNNLIAITALNNIESNITGPTNSSNHIYVGLFAHMYMVNDDIFRKALHTRLTRIEESINMSGFNQAIYHFVNQMDFSTANKLVELKTEILSRIS